MSEEKSPSTAPKENPPADDSLRQVRHDLRHALYVLDLALTLLADARNDETRFSDVLQMLRKEQVTINSLVEDLLKLAAGNPVSTRAGAGTEEPPTDEKGSR